MINLKTKEKYVKHYDMISDDVKFIAKSLIRLKILITLYESPTDMKELTRITDLNYSSVSTALHKLELNGMIYRKSNKYYLVNSIRLQVKNLIELAIIINLLEEIFNIIQGHVIDKIPKESIVEFHLLKNAELLESDWGNPNKVLDLIESTLDEANSARCILPVYYDGFNEKLNDLQNSDKFVEIKVAKSLLNVYEENSNVRYLSTFSGRNNFLLIVTNEVMIFGLFNNENMFDKNRIIISKSRDSLKWANNLFRYFKKIHK